MSTDNSQVVPAVIPAKATVAAINEAAVASGAAQKNTVATVVQKVNKGGFSDKPTLGELVEFQLTGLLVVFTVLGSITIFCYLIARVLRTIAPEQYYGKPKAALVPGAPVASIPAKPEQLASPAATVKTIHPGLSDDKLLAILATAVQEVMGQSASVVKFRTMGSMDWTWSVQGRVSQHLSHKL